VALATVLWPLLVSNATAVPGQAWPKPPQSDQVWQRSSANVIAEEAEKATKDTRGRGGDDEIFSEVVSMLVAACCRLPSDLARTVPARHSPLQPQRINEGREIMGERLTQKFQFFAPLRAGTDAHRVYRGVTSPGEKRGSYWRAGWSASGHTPTESICDLASALCGLPRAGHGSAA
jgi:hypothetical protein